ncbi:hypothetical protein GDO81_001939 [Engystomops pustulosus]|uniref:Olfactory receptor n=1 Tax=Engystomops pustulosus TaxID=76066 RepID=A0AAV7DHZ0_ENGPU|nr:hypothetical protein GDO81_001939 [Engystomops pustulosus]
MDLDNTTLKHFVIVGFTLNSNLQAVFLLIFLFMYTLTVVGNLVIIVIIHTNDRLTHVPMYFFLTHLSFVELCYTTTISPNFLDLIVKRQKSITFTECLIQLYLFLSLASVENFLLATMAYDRYLAICKPLQYHILMNSILCRNFAIFCWLGGCLIPVVPIILVSQIKYCRPYIINHFFCDVSPLFALSCTNISHIKMFEYVCAASVLLSSCLVILMSYVLIVSAILMIQTSHGRRKAFSTCASHLIVVILFFGPGILIYVSPLSHQSVALNKWMSLLYTQVTPLLNPFVYSLRNEEVKLALKGVVRQELRKQDSCTSIHWDYKSHQPECAHAQNAQQNSDLLLVLWACIVEEAEAGTVHTRKDAVWRIALCAAHVRAYRRMKTASGRGLLFAGLFTTHA